MRTVTLMITLPLVSDAVLDTGCRFRHNSPATALTLDAYRKCKGGLI